jgi:alkylated DNA nucleotide flippase Atl1
LGVIIPCHRVLGGDGSLTGYAGGLHRKTALLSLEGMAFEGSSANSKSASAKLAATINPTPCLF